MNQSKLNFNLEFKSASGHRVRVSHYDDMELNDIAFSATPAGLQQQVIHVPLSDLENIVSAAAELVSNHSKGKVKALRTAGTEKRKKQYIKNPRKPQQHQEGHQQDAKSEESSTGTK